MVDGAQKNQALNEENKDENLFILKKSCIRKYQAWWLKIVNKIAYIYL